TIYNKPVYDEEQSNIFFDTINQQLIITPFIHGFDTVHNIISRIYVDDVVFSELPISANAKSIQLELDDLKHSIRIQIGFITVTYDYVTFDEKKVFNSLFLEKYAYTPLASLMNNGLFVKYVICKDADGEPATVQPPLFIKLIEKLTQNSYLCEAYHDNGCSWKSKLGTLYAEFEPMYFADTNNKRRLNASIFAGAEGQTRTLHYDCSKVELDESKWSEEIDYFVIEEDSQW
nr:hypothetical protein [Acholeplasmatales bacterium]